MTEKKNDPDFTFGRDDAGEDYKDDLTTRQVAKLNQKVTLISVIIPFILIILVVFIYFDINSKVGRVDSTGTKKVQSISKELEITVESLKTKSNKLEKRLNNKIDSTDKTLNAVNKRLKKAEKNISFMTWSKSDKKKTNAELKKNRVTAEKIKTEIDALTKKNRELAALAAALEKKTAEIDAIAASVKNLKSELTEKTGGLVTSEVLKNRLKKQKMFYKLEIEQLADRFDKKISLLKYAEQAEKKNPAIIEKDIKQ